MLTNKTKFDFWILFAPRSGSHMLASALDGHPEIQCGAECWTGESRFKHWLGCEEKRLKGTTVIPDTIGKMAHCPDKIILLLRDPQSLGMYKNEKSTIPHILKAEPEKAAYKQERQHFIGKQQECIKISCDFENVLSVHYNLLTQNKDCREFPREQSDRICDFLGVERLPLRPAFYKARTR